MQETLDTGGLTNGPPSRRDNKLSAGQRIVLTIILVLWAAALFVLFLPKIG